MPWRQGCRRWHFPRDCLLQLADGATGPHPLSSCSFISDVLDLFNWRYVSSPGTPQINTPHFQVCVTCTGRWSFCDSDSREHESQNHMCAVDCRCSKIHSNVSHDARKEIRKPKCHNLYLSFWNISWWNKNKTQYEDKWRYFWVIQKQLQKDYITKGGCSSSDLTTVT